VCCRDFVRFAQNKLSEATARCSALTASAKKRVAASQADAVGASAGSGTSSAPAATPHDDSAAGSPREANNKRPKVDGDANLKE
jgi:hypothetical protein